MSKINFTNKLLKRFIIFTLIISTSFSTVFLTNNVNATTTKSNTFTLYVSGYTNYKYCYDVLNLVNEERTKRKLKPLTMSKTLLDLANQRAAEVSILFSHTTPFGGKYNCSKYFDNGKLPYNVVTSIGENIAIGQNTPNKVVSDWMHSEGHKKNILSKKYKSIGIGCFLTNNKICWVQSFCSNKNKVAKKSTSKTFKTYKIKCISKYAKVYKTKSTYSVKVGNKDNLSLYTIDQAIKKEYGYYIKTILNNNSFNFKSSNTKIATVNSKGVVRGVKAGNCNVTATIKGTNKKYTFKINVKNN